MDDNKPKSPALRPGPKHLPPIETRFKPGQSGNPGGRMSPHAKSIYKAKGIAAKYTPAAVKLLVEQIYDASLPPAVRQSAAEKLCAYNLPKAAQAIELTGEGGGPLQVASLDVGKLTFEELERLIAVSTQSLPAAQTIDVTPVPLLAAHDDEGAK